MTMPVSEATYQRVALEDGDHPWELVCGRLRRKPGMTAAHNMVSRLLADELRARLSRDQFIIAETSARLRVSTGNYYVPDLCVIPRAYVERAMRERPNELEVYNEPVPFVLEVWSPSTGEYDVEEKFPEYQRRGDLEIWRIHPIERTLTAWRRQPDGGYSEHHFAGGTVTIASLPGVRVRLEDLFLPA
jgi:Uma2 family endonuclease